MFGLGLNFSYFEDFGMTVLLLWDQDVLAPETWWKVTYLLSLGISSIDPAENLFRDLRRCPHLSGEWKWFTSLLLRFLSLFNKWRREFPIDEEHWLWFGEF
jgi:hypothetical protein